MSPLALALALVAPACTLKITDFKESTTSATTAVTDSDGSSSSGSSSSTGSTTDNTSTEGGVTTNATDDTTTNGTTGNGGNFPACHAYTQDPETGDADACAAELGCADFTDSVDCQEVSYYNEEAQSSVECRWGTLLTEGTYIEAEQICDGNIMDVCRAAVFLGEGGPPCEGFYRVPGDTLEVLNLSCSTPITGDWSECYSEGGDSEFPPCDHCFPPFP